jgi:hypothetical protein
MHIITCLRKRTNLTRCNKVYSRGTARINLPVYTTININSPSKLYININVKTIFIKAKYENYWHLHAPHYASIKGVV